MIDFSKRLEVMLSVDDACGAASDSFEDQLAILSLAWAVCAARARMEASAVDGRGSEREGRSREQQRRQLAELAHLKVLVASDEPDLMVADLVRDGVLLA